MKRLHALLALVVGMTLLSGCGRSRAGNAMILSRMMFTLVEHGHAKQLEIATSTGGSQVYWIAEEINTADSTRLRVAEGNLSVQQTALLRAEVEALGTYVEPVAGQAAPAFVLTADLIGHDQLQGFSAANAEAGRDALAGRPQLSLLLGAATQSPSSPWRVVLYPDGSDQPLGARPPKLTPRQPVMPSRGP